MAEKEREEQEFLEDDSDMKIVVPHKETAKASEEEVHRTVDEWRRIQQKGLIKQAQSIGEHMAGFASAALEKDAASAAICQQMWLCVFAVTVGCERYVENSLAARTVLNGFHDTFRDLCSEAYENSGYSMALSFYYLAVRSGDDMQQEIGRTFAMLCGDEHNEAWQRLGKRIFHDCLDQMETLCRPLNRREDV